MYVRFFDDRDYLSLRLWAKDKLTASDWRGSCGTNGHRAGWTSIPLDFNNMNTVYVQVIVLSEFDRVLLTNSEVYTTVQLYTME
jgi:hypothetical protein